MKSAAHTPVKVKSVFFHLILSFIVIVALIAGGVQGIFYLLSDGEWEMQSNWRMALSKYAWYMSGEIGNPPDANRAKAIAEENSLKMFIIGPQFEWRSHPDLELNPQDILPIPPAGFRGGFGPPGGPASHGNERLRRFKMFHHPHLPITVMRGRGKIVVQVEREPYRYIFITEPPLAALRNPWLIFGVIVWVAFVLLLFYWRVRRIFLPLQSLQFAFEKLGEGQLDYKIKEEGRNEFKYLFASFNGMGDKLNTLWQGQRRLLRDMSHELRTPLTRMKLSLAMLPETPQKNELVQNVDELTDIIVTILEAEKLESGVVPEVSEYSIHDVLMAVIEKQQKLFPDRKIELRETGSFVLRGNVKLIEMALANVINNSLKFSKKLVEVGVSHEKTVDENFVKIEIKDQGIGLHEDDLQKLFTPFFRAQNSHGESSTGIGLGLNLTQRIVKAHRGNIEVHSQVGVGTILTVFLPLKFT